MDQYLGPCIWIIVIGFELWAAQRRPDLTLSRTVARTFHTTDPVGRKIFAVAWTTLAVWFAKHIIRDVGK